MAETRYPLGIIRANEDKLQAEILAMIPALPNFLAILGPDPTEPSPQVLAVFSTPLSELDVTRLLVVAAAHIPGVRRRLRSFNAIRQDILAWLNIPANAPAYALRLGQAQATSITIQLRNDPQLAARVSLPVDPMEDDV